ncbi:hypothetical protein KC19_3G142500 [Ceratodon purpureus]|uniref:Uncharacterized protein n=1 Tax=Ceratodon purpureus TaxID=3225 RepID=A0A8T0IKN7_CERPU|nr:hypothetical protein KC19_3G142500 [Ceratodon purpureus]
MATATWMSAMAMAATTASSSHASRLSLAASTRIGMTPARWRVEPSPRRELQSGTFVMKDGAMSRRLVWGGARRIGGDEVLRPSALKSEQGGVVDGGDGGGGSDGGGALSWVSSAVVFAFFGALVAYAAVLAPGQTPYRDQYFIEKLVGLRSNDGFAINTILWCEFFIMGLWPMIYSSLILPSGRNKKGGVPEWPFLILSFGVGAFALLPYFALWKPPPPKVTKQELQSFPFNVLENKLVSVGVLLSGSALLVTAALAGADQWTEMYQYFRESKFIHVMSIDFLTLSTLAPFWVYNDMATRKWLDKGSWLLPLTLVPYVGPALYLCLRPSLPVSMVEEES